MSKDYKGQNDQIERERILEGNDDVCDIFN